MLQNWRNLWVNIYLHLATFRWKEPHKHQALWTLWNFRFLQFAKTASDSVAYYERCTFCRPTEALVHAGVWIHSYLSPFSESFRILTRSMKWAVFQFKIFWQKLYFWITRVESVFEVISDDFRIQSVYHLMLVTQNLRFSLDSGAQLQWSLPLRGGSPRCAVYLSLSVKHGQCKRVFTSWCSWECAVIYNFCLTGR